MEAIEDVLTALTWLNSPKPLNIALLLGVKYRITTIYKWVLITLQWEQNWMIMKHPSIKDLLWFS